MTLNNEVIQATAPETIFTKGDLRTEALQQILIEATSNNRLLIISSDQLKANPNVFFPVRGSKEIIPADAFLKPRIPIFEPLAESSLKVPNIWHIIGEIANDIIKRSRLADQKVHVVRMSNLVNTANIHKDKTETIVIKEISTQLKLLAGLDLPEVNFKLEASDDNLAEYGKMILKLIIAFLEDKYDKEAKDKIVLVMPEEQANNSHN